MALQAAFLAQPKQCSYWAISSARFPPLQCFFVGRMGKMAFLSLLLSADRTDLARRAATVASCV
jgi:hypothetical protein